MTLSFSNFNKILNKNFFCEDNPKLAVGVSGGPDSIALCILLNKWLNRKNGKLIALLVDHGIRAESFYESIKTKDFLKKNNIKSKILSVSKDKVQQGKLSQSRSNRFEKLLNYCQKNKIFYLFLAHHFDDNLETFILRKIAGSNIEGLNSMQFLKIFKNVQIIRPMLSYTKQDILLFNKKYKLEYVEDPSNVDIKYTRTAIREYLLKKTVNKKQIYNEFNLIKKNYNSFRKMIFQILNIIILKAELNSVVLDYKEFIKLNIDMKSNIIIKTIQYISNSKDQIRTKKIIQMIEKILKFKKISIKSNKIMIYRESNKIFITKFI